MLTVWHIELLGGLRGRSEAGKRFAPGVSRVGMLFASLVLAPDRSLTREYLATLLWPESDEAAARARLRQELSVLRRQLEPEGVPEGSVLLRERDRIALVPGAVRTDVEQFLALLEKARTANAERERLLNEAVELYRGELLPGYDYEGLVLERTHLAQRYENALRDLAAAQQASGNYHGAEASLRRLVAQTPYLEEVHTDLMCLYAAQGQPTRVREQYRELERTLRNEFDAEPSEDTRLLFERLCRDVTVAASITPPDKDSKGSLKSRPLAEISNDIPPLAVVAVPNGHPSPAPTAPLAPIGTKRRFWSTVFAVLAALCCLGFLLFRRQPDDRIVLLRGYEDWVYAYKPRFGELPDCAPRAMVLVGQNIFVTGFIQTEKEDTDILTLKLAPDSTELKRARYSGPAHDCDRPFSIVADGHGGVYVAGESYYVPGRTRVSEGWHTVVIHYDANLNKLWAHESPIVTKEGADDGVQVVADSQDGCWVGGTALVNGAPHLLLQRYDGFGNCLWFKTVEHESEFSRMRINGNRIYACGSRLQQDSLGVHRDGMAVCFDEKGAQQWETPISGSGLGAMACDILPQGTGVYVGGIFHVDERTQDGPGLALGMASLDAEHGYVKQTMMGQQAYSEIAPCRLEPYDSAVQVIGQCLAPNHTRDVVIDRYNSRGDLVENRHYDGQDGYSGVIGAKNYSHGTFGLALVPTYGGDTEHGNLLALTFKYQGGKDLALVFQPLGSGTNSPRAIIVDDSHKNDPHGYFAAQTKTSTGPTLTVTKFHFQ